MHFCKIKNCEHWLNKFYLQNLILLGKRYCLLPHVIYWATSRLTVWVRCLGRCIHAAFFLCISAHRIRIQTRIKNVTRKGGKDWKVSFDAQWARGHCKVFVKARQLHKPQLLSRLCCSPSTSGWLTATKIPRHYSLSVRLYLAFRQPSVTAFDNQSCANVWKYFSNYCAVVTTAVAASPALARETWLKPCFLQDYKKSLGVIWLIKNSSFCTRKFCVPDFGTILLSCFYLRLKFAKVLLLMCFYCNVWFDSAAHLIQDKFLL